jgi:hypothetical protein
LLAPSQRTRMTCKEFLAPGPAPRRFVTQRFRLGMKILVFYTRSLKAISSSASRSVIGPCA